MKKTLRDKLIAEISRIDERCNQLLAMTLAYKEDNDFKNAMKCDIMWSQLKTVAQSLKELL